MAEDYRLVSVMSFHKFRHPNPPPLFPMPPKSKSTKDNLGVELFELMQADQGHGFISDSMCEASREDVIRMARTSLYHSKEAVKKLKAFLDKQSKQTAPKKGSSHE